MAIEAIAWALNQKTGGAGPKFLLVLLADHMSRTGECYPGTKRLARIMECDRATVFRHMRTLEGKGLVTRSPRKRGDGGQASNSYHLNLPAALIDDDLEAP